MAGYLMVNTGHWSNVFFQGQSNYLQSINSCTSEKVMLQFVRSDDVPVLTVNNSFFCITHLAIREN